MYAVTAVCRPRVIHAPADVAWCPAATQTYACAVAGACMAIALKYAGTGDKGARDVLLQRVRTRRRAATPVAAVCTVT